MTPLIYRQSNLSGLMRLVILLTIPALACNALNTSRSANQDPFYSSQGDWDSIRVPLIKPYEIVKADGSPSGWYINLAQTLPYWQVGNIEQIAVENGLILLQAPRFRGDEYDPVWHWIAIAPESNIEAGFATEDELLEFIKDYGLEEPTWLNADDAFKEFAQTGCLDWILNCNP